MHLLQESGPNHNVAAPSAHHHPSQDCLLHTHTQYETSTSPPDVFPHEASRAVRRWMFSVVAGFTRAGALFFSWWRFLAEVPNFLCRQSTYDPQQSCYKWSICPCSRCRTMHSFRRYVKNPLVTEPEVGLVGNLLTKATGIVDYVAS